MQQWLSLVSQVFAGAVLGAVLGVLVGAVLAYPVLTTIHWFTYHTR